MQQEKQLSVPHPDLRVGDVERDACVATLTEHHLQGRLSVEEVQSRHRAALAAVRASDLEALLADLPRGHRGFVATAPVRPRRSETSPALPRIVERAQGLTLLGAASALAPAGVIVSASALAQYAWEYSNEGALLGGLFVGSVGYTTHAVQTRLRVWFRNRR